MIYIFYLFYVQYISPRRSTTVSARVPAVSGSNVADWPPPAVPPLMFSAGSSSVIASRRAGGLKTPAPKNSYQCGLSAYRRLIKSGDSRVVHSKGPEMGRPWGRRPRDRHEKLVACGDGLCPRWSSPRKMVEADRSMYGHVQALTSCRAAFARTTGTAAPDSLRRQMSRLDVACSSGIQLFRLP